MMHEKALRRLQAKVAEATTREHQDYWLDKILEYQNYATEWDAGEWDLPWANESIPELEALDGPLYPTEPKMRTA